MRKNILLLIILGLLCVSATAQKISKPTKTSVPPTANQIKLISEGIKLHDSKRFDDAIAMYQQVLKENPDCTTAIYELALSYYAIKDLDKTLETAYKLVQYQGKDGILGYGLFANALDDQGKSKDAIVIYQKAIKVFEGDSAYTEHLSSLYYNLGVTQTRQKNYKEAKEALKKSVETNFQYASPSYLLSEVYFGTKYKIPAFLAASRLLTLELQTSRSARATTIILNVLKPAEKNAKGEMTINFDFFAPKDEGDFGALEILLPTLTTIKTDENKKKSDNEVFAEAIGTLISLVEETKGIKSTFVGKTYVPFMSEMKKKGYVKHFAYIVLQQNGNQEAEKWLIDQGQTTIDFINWAKSFNHVK